MPDVIIGQSYFLRFDPKLWEAKQPYPPLGSLYAASYLEKKGYDVAFFDAMLAESESDWQDALRKYQPRYAVLFEDNFNYLSKMCLLRMREAAFQMCKMAKNVGCVVIVCGSDATDHPGKYFAAGADYVLRGEGELTLGELLDELSGRTTTGIHQIKSLFWPNGNSGLNQSDPRPVLKDLDTLPFPAWEKIDLDRYRKTWIKNHGYFSMNMVTTRGCPYHCNWCAKPIWGQRYNSRSPLNVVEELAWLKENYHPDHIGFADDILGLKPGWIQEFADLVESHKVHTPFKSLNRADLLLRSDTIPSLKRAGCQTCWIGAESGSQKILDAMEKGTTTEQIHEAAKQLHEIGIKVGFFLQFGYPGETWQDIEKTMQMVRDCKPDDIGISVSYPLPGTKFYDLVKDQLGTKQNWQDSDDLAMLYQGPYSTAFYRKLHTVIHKNFRRQLARENLKAAYHSPQKLNMNYFRKIGRIAFNSLTLPFYELGLQRLKKQSGIS